MSLLSKIPRFVPMSNKTFTRPLSSRFLSFSKICSALTEIKGRIFVVFYILCQCVTRFL